jgi:5-methylcytosine-specific restriction protein A
MPRAPRRCPGDHGQCAELITGSARYCPTHTKAWAGERTASSRITSSWAWQQTAPDILARDGYECRLRYPGICTGRATTVDKRDPAARRPDRALDPDNLQAACAECNGHKARTADRKRP